MRETAIVGDVLSELNTLAGCYAWRQNTGTAWINGRPVKFAEPGCADIIAVYRGQFVAVECKTATGRQRAAQKTWQAAIEAAGGRYLLIRSVRDLIEQLPIPPDHPRRLSRVRVIPR